MKKTFFLVVGYLTMNFHGFTQSLMEQEGDTGVRFEKDLSWDEIKELASRKNKYIFVDCYASWCGPCKAMDKNVFTLAKVGKFYNEKFISVRFQMDTTKYDAPEVKSKYSDAHRIYQEFCIKSFPTLLFFSPDARLVHKAVRGYYPDEFIQLGTDALDKNKQYYKLLENYNQGTLNSPYLKELAQMARNNGDDSISQRIAMDYIKKYVDTNVLQKEDILFIKEYGRNEMLANILAENYISKLPDSIIFEKDNLEFIWTFTSNTSQKGFKIFYYHTAKVDEILGRKGVARGHVEYIITKEDVQPILNQAMNNGFDPDWKKIFSSLTLKYDNYYANRIVANIKPNWFGHKKEWKNYTKSLVEKIEITNGNNMDGFTLNNDAMEIFLKSENSIELKRAIFWIEKLFNEKPNESKNDPDILDTYANLLYKYGRKKDAIYWQEKAVALNPKNAELKNNLDKMRVGKPTWL